MVQQRVNRKYPLYGQLQERFTVFYDSKVGKRFILQKADEQLVFNRIPYSLYFHYVGAREILMVATTTGNRKGYTDRDFAAATEAPEGMATMGKPLPVEYINMVHSGMLRNFPVTTEVVRNANKGFGLDVAPLKGNTPGKPLTQ